MPLQEIRFQLDAAGREWLRMRFTTVRGQVTAFTVQSEAPTTQSKMSAEAARDIVEPALRGAEEDSLASHRIA